MASRDKSTLLAALPPEWPDDLLPAIQAAVRASGRILVVLDDDPTGTQTVHDVAVLTEWSVPALAAELKRDAPAYYVLTNSRSLPPAAAAARNAEIGRNLRVAAAATAAETAGVDIAVVSRSDSTLRGHFPGEVDALVAALGSDVDATLVVPFFLEGGRYTIDDVHYVAEGDMLVPAGETQFAQDAAFGFRASNLRDWVEEKTDGAVQAKDVASISLDTLRQRGPDAVARALLALPKGSVCVVNAVSYRDVEVFVLGLLAAEASGRRYMYRTAASFVRVRAGIPERALLSAQELNPGSGGILFVIGSYVQKSTDQLAALLRTPGVVAIELNARALLEESHAAAEIARAAATASDALAGGAVVVVYTSRELITGADVQRSLAIGNAISSGLVGVLQQLTARPAVLVAKGGITSSDVATAGLGMRRALVLGQALPGVPVWRAGAESRFPGLTYVVFPGNVGASDALARLAQSLRT